MGELAVVAGAILTCDKGTLPTPLTVTTMSFTSIGGALVAPMVDHKPGANIKPFGVCAVTQKPCMPVTPAPWAPCATTLGLSGSSFPVVIASSQLPCAIGGVIKVQSPGQATVFTGQATVGTAMSGSELQDVLKDFGWGVGTGGLGATMQEAEKALQRATASGWPPPTSPAQQQSRIRAERANANASKALKVAGRTAGGLGYVPGGVETVQRAADGNIKGAISKGAGTVAGGVAGSAAAGACVTASGPAAPITAVPCAIGGAAVGAGVGWGTEKAVEGVFKAADNVVDGFKSLTSLSRLP